MKRKEVERLMISSVSHGTNNTTSSTRSDIEYLYQNLWDDIPHKLLASNIYYTTDLLKDLFYLFQFYHKKSMRLLLCMAITTPFALFHRHAIKHKRGTYSIAHSLMISLGNIKYGYEDELRIIYNRYQTIFESLP